MLSLMMMVVIGGAIGAGLGYFGQCSSGTCPLTATWWRGALYGAAMGFMFYLISGRNGAASVEQPSKNVLAIQEDQFEAQVVQSSLPVVVDFYAPWCGPCRQLSPMLDKLAGPLSDKIKFVKINLDEASRLAQHFQIEAVPTLMFFKNGKLVDRYVGLPSSHELNARLQSLAAKSPGLAAAH